MSYHPLILIDVHGVVADFVGRATEVFGVDFPEEQTRYDFWRDWPGCPTDEEFWGRIDEEGADFWADLDVYGDGARLVREVQELGVDWAFCTAAVTHRGSYEGTVDFCKDNFGDCRVIGCIDKHLLAAPGRVLIDDAVHNIGDFQRAGGIGYLWPRPWNCRTIATSLLGDAIERAIHAGQT